MVTDGRPLNVSARALAGTIALSLSRNAMYAAPMVNGAVPNALLNTTRTRDPPMLARTICRSVWFVKCVNGAGPNVVPAGACAGFAAGGGAGQALRINGAGAGGPGGGGICGRPINAVAHVPTHRSVDCACNAGWSVVSAATSSSVTTIRFSFFIVSYTRNESPSFAAQVFLKIFC